jgi:hypothetical protein
MEFKDFRDEIQLRFGSSPPLSVFFRGSPDTLSSAAAAAAAPPASAPTPAPAG